MPPAASLRLVTTYTLVHGIAEFLTALTLFSMLAVRGYPGWEVALYTAIAFGGPIVAALAVTTAGSRVTEGPFGLVGAALLGAGLLTTSYDLLTVFLLGAGSALIHIAAGTATLKEPKPATAVGVFEATGAIGLAAGTVLGSGVWSQVSATPAMWFGAAVMLAGGFAVWRWGTSHIAPGLAARTGVLPHPATIGVLATAIGALAVVSIARSLVGTGAPQSWKDGAVMVITASVAVALGRAMGGIIADRWGYLVPTLVGLSGAGLAWSVWPTSPVAGLVGAFCLALPMAPVILAMLKILERPALAFGLAQLFQVPAAVAGGLGLGPWGVALAMVASALMVAGAALLLSPGHRTPDPTQPVPAGTTTTAQPSRKDAP